MIKTVPFGEVPRGSFFVWGGGTFFKLSHWEGNQVNMNYGTFEKSFQLDRMVGVVDGGVIIWDTEERETAECTN